MDANEKLDSVPELKSQGNKLFQVKIIFQSTADVSYAAGV